MFLIFDDICFSYLRVVNIANDRVTCEVNYKLKLSYEVITMR